MCYLLVMGNWKLNGSIYMVNEFIVNLCKELSIVEGCGVVIVLLVIYLN